MSQHPPPPYPHPEDVAAASGAVSRQAYSKALTAAALQHQDQSSVAGNTGATAAAAPALQHQEQSQYAVTTGATAASALQHQEQSQYAVTTGATAAAAASSSSVVAPEEKAKTLEELKVSLQEQIDKIRDTREKIYTVFEALKNSPTPTAVSIPEFGSSVDTANLELQTAKEELEKYKKKTNVDDTSLAGGSSSSKSKSKKKRKSYKSYHPEIGKTRKHHSHDDHKRVSFVHQA